MEESKIVIGVDEAGYGPNLGPLVIAATAWQVPRGLSEFELEALLSQTFCPQPWKTNCKHIPLGDSKKLYKSGAGLASLEAGLFSMLDVAGLLSCDKPCTLGDFLRATTPPFTKDEIHHLPWYEASEHFVTPKAIESLEIARLSELASKCLKQQNIELLSVRSSILTESRFNTRTIQYGSKGQVLSEATLALVAELCGTYEQQPIEVFCDRQGGRKNYLPVLVESFPEEWFATISISAERCSYRSTGARPIDVHFSVGGDHFPPTGLASMTAKYTRERIMEAFNAFWSEHTPDLQPTAGYPVDALRFRKAIEATAIQLGMPSEAWWRCK